LRDFVFAKMTQEMASALEMLNAFGSESHDAAGGGVDGNRVVAENQNPARLGSPLDGPVAFHTEDAIHDGEVRADGAVDIEQGASDSGPVENVLRPTVTAAGDDAKHVFHGESDAGPVVGLQLGHGNKKVRTEHGGGEIKLLERGGASAQGRGVQSIHVEIHKGVQKRPKEFAETHGFDDGLGIAVEGGTIANEDSARAEAKKAFASCGDYRGMGINGGAFIPSDEIGLEENAFVLNRESKLAQRFVHDRRKVALIAFGAANGNARERAGEGVNQRACV
jgi:hypothetical protein